MAYAIKCEDCGNNFTKFSNRDANRKCEECKPRKGNRYRERRNVVDEFTTRLTNLEEWQERMQIEMELWQDAVQAEMLGKVEEVFAENMESMRPDFGPELTKIEENLANKLATINTRVMALSPNSIAMDKLNDLDVRTDAKLNQMETLFTRMNSLLGDGKWTEPTEKFKPIRRSAVKLTLQTRMTLVEAALQFMFETGDATRLFKRGDLTDGPWRGITLNSASRLMQDMLRAKQIIRASPKSHHYGLHPDEYERRCLTIPTEEDDSDIKKR